jgi:hypothetical protein
MDSQTTEQKALRALVKSSSGQPLNDEESKCLSQHLLRTMPFHDLLPYTFLLDGKPMDVNLRRPMFVPLFERDRKCKKEIYLCGRQIGKCLNIETPILTTQGWKKMGDLQVGDFVYNTQSLPVKIIWVSDVMRGHKCYELSFDCGEKIIADSEHLWVVSHGEKQQTLTTQQLFNSISRKNLICFFIKGPKGEYGGKNIYIQSIKKTKSVPVRCIKVEDSEGMFLCGRSLIPTHNTVSGSASMLMNLLFRPGFRIMYVAPLSIYVQRLHHMYFSTMMNNFRLPWKIQTDGCVKNVGEKSFYNGSHFHGVSCFNNAENARGIPTDWNFYDEVQGLNLDFLPAIQETLGASDVKYQWETFVGTALSIENTIAILFKQSSACEWHMKCPNAFCNHWNVPTLDAEALTMIQPHGIACAKCKTLLDVTRGEWVPAYQDRHQSFRGFHIPQTIVKDRIEPQQNYMRVYNKLHGIERYSTTKFCQEVLGIPTESGDRGVTEKEIRDASTLPFKNGEPGDLRRYMYITGGADWGGNEVTSFTVGTAVGWDTATSTFHVLGAVRPLGIPSEERHLPIAAFMKKAGVQAIGADVGFVGAVQTKNLGRVAGVVAAGIGYVTSKSFYIPKAGNNFSVDRSTLLFIMFTLIKNKKILFPSDPSFWSFTQDLTALFVEDIETPTQTIRRYARYQERADDFAHALAYAIFAAGILGRPGLDLPSMVGMSPNSSISSDAIDTI